MPKAVNKRQASAVTACAICTTNLISIVFNKSLIRAFIMTTNPLSYSLTKTYCSHYAILIIDKNLFKPLSKILYSDYWWESIF